MKKVKNETLNIKVLRGVVVFKGAVNMLHTSLFTISSHPFQDAGALSSGYLSNLT
jgi:hypothetical protein